MIRRSHEQDGTVSTVTYSDCEKYRYDLTRTWDAGGPCLLYIMLNPSKADERRNDPTVERCERRARALGYGALRVTNIFAWRDTDPHAMRRAKKPIGPDNDTTLADSCHWANGILAAWGTHGAHMDRGPQIAAMLHAQKTPLFHLGLTKDGHPRHPLYIAYQTQPTRWDME